MSKRKSGSQINVVSLVASVAGTILRGIVLVAIVYYIYQMAIVCYNYGYRIFTEPAVSVEGAGRNVTVSVTEDMSPLEIGELFKEKGLVKDDKLFAMQYLLSEYYKDVRPGVFELNTSMTSEEMMAAMSVKEEDSEAEDSKAGEPESGDSKAEDSKAEDSKAEDSKAEEK